MSATTRFDIRIPIGALFAGIGLILTAYGVVTSGNTEMYAKSESIVINLWWGLAMMVFGGGMLFFGFRAPPPAAAKNESATLTDNVGQTDNEFYPGSQ